MCPLIDRHGGKSVKRLAILALLIVGAFASLRLAGASASQVVTWKGNGLDSIVPCSEGQTPSPSPDPSPSPSPSPSPTSEPSPQPSETPPPVHQPPSATPASPVEGQPGFTG